MENLTENAKGYLAGIIDGEGSICLTKQHANQHRSPEITVTSTTYEMLEYMKELCGGSISHKKIYAEHHKEAWKWGIKGDKAIEFLTQIKDYLLVPEKKYRADLIVNEYKAVTPRNGRYNEETLAKKLDFEKRFFEFNPK